MADDTQWQKDLNNWIGNAITGFLGNAWNRASQGVGGIVDFLGSTTPGKQIANSKFSGTTPASLGGNMSTVSAAKTATAAKKATAKKKATSSGINTTTLAGILKASGGSVKAPNTSGAGLMPVASKASSSPTVSPIISGLANAAAASSGSGAGTGTGTGTGTDTGTSIEDVYSPVLDYLKQQEIQTNQRYATNAANINNIFGTLSTVRAQDIPKIQQQYATSLAQQQEAVAGRMALQNAEAGAGREGANAAAGELGSGGMPVPTSSATGAAYTASNTDANAYQTTWNALQNVMSAQQQENVRTSMEGYDYQKVAALEGLQKSLEDKLSQLSGNEAQVQSDIAQAKVSAQQNIASAQAQMAADMALQQLKNQGTANVANIRAGATTNAAAIRANGATASPKTYPSTLLGWEQKVRDSGAPSFGIGSIKSNAETALARWKADPNNQGKTPTKVQIFEKWRELYGKGAKQDKSATSDLVYEYITKYMPTK